MSWCTTRCTATSHHPTNRYRWHRHPFPAELEISSFFPITGLTFDRDRDNWECATTTQASSDFGITMKARPFGVEVCRVLFKIPDDVPEGAPVVFMDLHYGKPVNTQKTDWTQDPPNFQTAIDLYASRGRVLEPLGEQAFHYWRPFDTITEPWSEVHPESFTTTRFFDHRVELSWNSFRGYVGPILCARLDCILEDWTTYCGDGIIQEVHETCDDGMNNWPGHDHMAAHYCSNTCTIV